MDAIVDYASSMIDITNAMLEHSARLNPDQAEFLEIMYRKSMEFTRYYIDHQNAPVQVLRRYLSHDAISPLAIVISYADFMLTDKLQPLPPAFAEAVAEVRDYADAIREELADLLEQVWSFMQEVGIPKD